MQHWHKVERETRDVGFSPFYFKTLVYYKSPPGGGGAGCALAGDPPVWLISNKTLTLYIYTSLSLSQRLSPFKFTK